MSSKRARVLITGGTGFIAPHLVSAIESQVDLVVQVRDATRNPINSSDRVRVHVGPLEPKEMLAALKDSFDYIVHLAGAVYGASTAAVLESNVVTTANTLEFMRETGSQKIIFMSTAAVWDDVRMRKFSEAIEPSPTTLYGLAKLAAERLIHDSFARGYLKSAVILRCNNTYGPGNRQGVVSHFLSQLRAGNPVQIDGDGQQIREPIFYQDIVRLLKTSLSKSDGFSEYAVSGGESITVLDMAQTIASVMKRPLQINWSPSRADKCRHLMFDISKIKNELGWEPTVRFEDGIRQTCKALGLI